LLLNPVSQFCLDPSSAKAKRQASPAFAIDSEGPISYTPALKNISYDNPTV
jgi:hypothetical protein